MLTSRTAKLNGPDTRWGAGISMVARAERCPVRQCPKCMREWPFDWDYCPDCAIWIQGREITKQIIRLVPAESSRAEKKISIKAPAQYAEGFFLACELQCDADPPTPENFRQAKKLMDIALETITSQCGTARIATDLGIVGYWDAGADISGLPARAATKILAETTRSERKESWQSFGVSLGIGIVSSEARRKSPNDVIGFGFRLAALAHPNGGLVDDAVYQKTVEHFDYRGVCPDVPRSKPLPEPVYKLIGAKPERSGTHHTAPDTIPMVGRRELVKMLDECCREVADGRLVVLHLIGDPGVGKSRLLREWLHANERQDRLLGWIRLSVHGVSYGGYSLHAWSQLMNSLMGSDAEASAAVLRRPSALVDVMTAYLHRLVRPALIIVDDLHWIDAASLRLIARFLDTAAGLPAFVILAYRRSFLNDAPDGKSSVHRRAFLRALGRRDLGRLIEIIAKDRNIEVPREWAEEITSKARGNPLYAIEAIGYLTETGRNSLSDSLPSSLAELLIQRIQGTLETTLPQIEQEVRLCMARLSFIGDSKRTLQRLEMLEERLAAWLDRFDVIQQESPPIVQKFLLGLKELDGSLALLNIFIGRQRPHCYRLAQALARIGGVKERR